MSLLVMPENAAKLVERTSLRERHPGLQLDRYTIPPADQKQQHQALEQVTQTLGDRDYFRVVRERRDQWFQRAEVTTWTQTTDGPLTLHLARANVMENAGLSLHPLYGFPYLPGSGLKGMARAFASEIAGATTAELRSVFGHEIDAEADDEQQAGGIIFMDAWPVKWPALSVDISNNHHGEYYGGNDAPGDWEAPVPVYFLFVPAGNAFQFAIKRRRDDVDPDTVDLAHGWLHGALVRLGAGAKTAAGYGCFQPAENPPAVTIEKPRLTKHANLRLTSPAFLAGANQSDPDSCDLRVPTLRGVLRQWWRMFHSGCLSRAELRTLESAVWGSTASGSPVQLHLTREGKATPPQRYQHPEDRQAGQRYLAYGMDEKGSAERYFMAPGAGWTLQLAVRDSYYQPVGNGYDPQPIKVSRHVIMDQVLAALWLMAQFGGVRAKNRKGFGSLTVKCDGLPADQQAAVALASQLRADLGLPNGFAADRAETASLLDPDLNTFQVELAARDCDHALDIIGRAYQAVAGGTGMKHEKGKAALGLPRKIDGPADTPIGHQKKYPSTYVHPKPKWLTGDPRITPEEDHWKVRHAAPIYLHLEPADGGKMTLRVLATPAMYLPSRQTSVEVLGKFMAAFEQNLRNPPEEGGRGGKRQPPRKTAPIAAATMVEVTLLERMEKSGPSAFRVQEERKNKGMLVYGKAPDPLPEVGAVVTVYRIPTSSAMSPQYRWSPPEPPRPKAQRGHRRN